MTKKSKHSGLFLTASPVETGFKDIQWFSVDTTKIIIEPDERRPLIFMGNQKLEGPPARPGVSLRVKVQSSNLSEIDALQKIMPPGHIIQLFLNVNNTCTYSPIASVYKFTVTKELSDASPQGNYFPPVDENTTKRIFPYYTTKVKWKATISFKVFDGHSCPEDEFFPNLCLSKLEGVDRFLGQYSLEELKEVFSEFITVTATESISDSVSLGCKAD